MMQDQTKIALVTGASRGLRKNTALALAKKGVGVIATYLNSEAEAKSVVSAIEAMGGKAVALQLDTGNIKTFEAFEVLTRSLAKELGHRQITVQAPDWNDSKAGSRFTIRIR